MFEQYMRRPALAAGLTGLLFAGLALAACAGAAPPTAEVPAASSQSEATATLAMTAEPTEAPAASSQSEATSTLAMTAEPTTAPTTETSAMAETPAAAPAAASKPTCQPVDKNDQLGQLFDYLSGYIENTKPVEAVATVSDTDWSKGPANAPLTMIEYGDFQ
jgi:hypothetical protein